MKTIWERLLMEAHGVAQMNQPVWFEVEAGVGLRKVTSLQAEVCFFPHKHVLILSASESAVIVIKLKSYDCFWTKIFDHQILKFLDKIMLR